MGSDNKNNTFFFIRLAVLLLLLVAFAGGIYYDRQVLVPAGMESVDNIAAAQSKEAVKLAAGMPPTESRKIGNFDVETYKFGRILPFLAGPQVHVIYVDDRISEIIKGPLTDEDKAQLNK